MIKIKNKIKKKHNTQLKITLILQRYTRKKRITKVNICYQYSQHQKTQKNITTNTTYILSINNEIFHNNNNHEFY